MVIYCRNRSFGCPWADCHRELKVWHANDSSNRLNCVASNLKHWLWTQCRSIRLTWSWHMADAWCARLYYDTFRACISGGIGSELVSFVTGSCFRSTTPPPFFLAVHLKSWVGGGGGGGMGWLMQFEMFVSQIREHALTYCGHPYTKCMWYW